MTSGGQDDVFLHWFTEQLKKIIREELASLVVKKGMGLFDMTSGAYNADIEAAVLARIQNEVVPYGVQVLRLGSVEVAFSDSDTEKLQKFTETQAYADLGSNPGLQGYAQAKMMMGAGEGMSKGGEASGNAMAGIGLGMGMAMANQFGQQQQRAQQPQAPQGQAGQVQCAKCGNMVASGKFCASCGAPLAAAGHHCTECGTALAPGAKFCGNCGKPQG
jgi:membrane protease subunit (stomatin/prohibitin family)